MLVGHWSQFAERILQFGISFSSSSVLQELSLLLAEKENAHVVLATDPDADRLAVAEKSDG